MLRGIWVRVSILVVTFALAFPLSLVLLAVPRWGNLTVHVGRIWSRLLLAAAGARVTYHGLDHARGRLPCIFIANHQSFIDVWVMMCLVPPTTRFVAKRELFRIPVFGWVLSASGCIPIDRGNRSQAIRSLEAAAERIRGGTSVVLYPEGTRSTDGRLQPFKKGAFHLALQAGVPIVPVAITGSFDVLAPVRLLARPGPVSVHVEPPIDVAPFQPGDSDGLLAVVRSAIEARFQSGPAPSQDPALASEHP